MPYNLLNKNKWLAEMERLSNTYIEVINDASSEQKEIELNIILSKRYSSRGMVFTGQEIVDEIQRKLSYDPNFIYEFTVVDNKSVVKIKHRVSFDDQERELMGINKDGDNVMLTIEELKSKYFKEKLRNDELKEALDKREADNFDMFKDIVNHIGLYQYVSNKKLILTLSKLLKEHNFYDTEKGTRYSFEVLSKKNKALVIRELFKKIYK